MTICHANDGVPNRFGANAPPLTSEREGSRRSVENWRSLGAAYSTSQAALRGLHRPLNTTAQPRISKVMALPSPDG